MKLKKEIVLTAVITAILTSSIAVAAVTLTAKDIGFKSTTEGWEVNNVEDAVNDLYVLGKDATGKKIYKLGEGRSFNISDIVGNENVGNYTEENFLVFWTKPTGSISIHRQEGHQYTKIASQQEFVKIYNQTSGDINITGGTFEMQQTVSGDDTVFKSTTTITPIVYFIDNIEVVE